MRIEADQVAIEESEEGTRPSVWRALAKRPDVSELLARLALSRACGASEEALHGDVERWLAGGGAR
jgi:hypothetical protein